MTDMNPPTTAAQTAHTPTPWTFDEVPTSCGRAFRIGSREIIDGHEASKSRGALTLPAYAVIYDDYGSGETVNKANASYIVECCNNYSSALAQLRQAREWQTGTPDISKNSQKAFWVAFKSKYQGSDKICCRFLTYCNEEIMPLSDSVAEGHEPKGAVPVGDDGEYAWTGWFEFSCDNCETQWAFDREVIAWMELPQYSTLTTTAPKEKP